jgi:hypothetical protein
MEQVAKPAAERWGLPITAVPPSGQPRRGLSDDCGHQADMETVDLLALSASVIAIATNGRKLMHPYLDRKCRRRVTARQLYGNIASAQSRLRSGAHEGDLIRAPGLQLRASDLA